MTIQLGQIIGIAIGAFSGSLIATLIGGWLNRRANRHAIKSAEEMIEIAKQQSTTFQASFLTGRKPDA